MTRTLINESLAENILGKLKSLSPREFVNLILEHMRRRSDFSDVQPGPPRGQDKGVDITAKVTSPTGERVDVAFECKRYISKTLGSPQVAIAVQGAKRAGVSACAIVSTREPSGDAREAVKTWGQEREPFQVFWKEWCGRGLALNLGQKTPSVLLRRFPELRPLLPVAHEYEELCPSFEILPPPCVTDHPKADRFYSGFPPTWDDLGAHHDIERIVYVKPEGIRESVLGLLAARGTLKTVAMLGFAGTGKTTLLRRLGMDAVSEGHLVLRLRDDWICNRLSLAKQIRDVATESSSTVLVLIDDASDLVLQTEILAGTLRELETVPSVVIVFAEQGNRWNRAVRMTPFLVEGETYFRHFVHNLLDSECEALVDKILQYERDEILSESYCNLPRAERLGLCYRVADRQLVVAMLQMRHGEQFQRIITREYERIPMDKGKDAYATVSYFNTYGLSIPPALLLRALDIATPTGVQEFKDTTEGLFAENRLGLGARHIVIARRVAAHALSCPEAKKAALNAVLSEIDIDNEGEEFLFLRMFAGENTHRRLRQDLGEDRAPQLLRSLYRDLRTSYGSMPPSYRKFVATSQAMVEHLLRDMEAARKCLDEAILLDPNFAFAHRKYAWLEHDEGRLPEAAERAIRAAELAPDNFLCIFHCARILSMNTVSNFRRAKSYLERARQLAPHDRKVIRQWEVYQGGEHVLEIMSGLADHDLIPSSVLADLRPGLRFLIALHGRDSSEAREQLRFDLQQMEETTTGELAELSDKTAEVDVGNSQRLQALIGCNTARLQYLAWFRRGESFDLDQVEQLFRTSMKLNPKDPFTHCWFGTFLKDARNDFQGASYEYGEARRLGNRLKNGRHHEHPLFLNNIALLIMDEVQVGLRGADSLEEAKCLLETAIARVRDTESNFFWPEVNLSLCLQLMEETGRTPEGGAQKDHR